MRMISEDADGALRLDENLPRALPLRIALLQTNVRHCQARCLTASASRAQHTEKAPVFYYSKVKMMLFRGTGGSATASPGKISRRNVMVSHLRRYELGLRGNNEVKDRKLRNAN
jgi:hypothetical protein